MNQLRMPSPAILVAVSALVAALAGTAVAAPDASTSAITKKKVKSITTKQINKLAPGLSVASAVTAGSAKSADRAQSAVTADSADSATTAEVADSANGVRPVPIDYTASTNDGRSLLFETPGGGVQISGACDGPDAVLSVEPGANTDNGLVTLDSIASDGSVTSDTIADFDHGGVASASPGFAGADTVNALLSYRSAAGETITGEFVVSDDSTIAQCVISGTLFVG